MTPAEIDAVTHPRRRARCLVVWPEPTTPPLRRSLDEFCERLRAQMANALQSTPAMPLLWEGDQA